MKMTAISKAALKAFAGRMAAMIGGPLTWLWTQVLYFGGQALIDFAAVMWGKFIRSGKQEEKKQVLEEKDKDPKSTNEDVGKAYEDYINTGRK